MTMSLYHLYVYPHHKLTNAYVICIPAEAVKRRMQYFMSSNTNQDYVVVKETNENKLRYDSMDAMQEDIVRHYPNRE